MFITFEGIENSGKSVQSQLLNERLKEEGIPHIYTREPGGIPSAEALRALLLNPQTKMHKYAEVFCYLAARVELVEKVIQPALNENKIVVCDRFVDSTFAYQGYGMNGGNVGFLNWLVDTHNLLIKIWPDLTIYIDIPVEESLKRFKNETTKDRIEQRGKNYFERVQKGYLRLAMKQPERIKVVDGQASIIEVSNIIWQIVSDKIKYMHRRRYIGVRASSNA